jgi:hypothetical protein
MWSVTTLPAPTTAREPLFTPPRMIAPSATQYVRPDVKRFPEVVSTALHALAHHLLRLARTDGSLNPVRTAQRDHGCGSNIVKWSRVRE